MCIRDRCVRGRRRTPPLLRAQAQEEQLRAQLEELQARRQQRALQRAEQREREEELVRIATELELRARAVATARQAFSTKGHDVSAKAAGGPPRAAREAVAGAPAAATHSADVQQVLSEEVDL
eukprot:4840480-Prymnesium_polylepis.1